MTAFGHSLQVEGGTMKAWHLNGYKQQLLKIFILL